MELSLADFVLAVLIASFALVGLLSLGSRRLHRLAEARSLSHRVICRLCLHAFEVQGSGKIIDCPFCGAANERGRSRKLG